MSITNTNKPINEQRIRGPKVAVFSKEGRSTPFEEGLIRADKENRVIASKNRVENAVRTNPWCDWGRLWPCWSGTIIAYEKPGQKLGAYIESIDPKTSYKWVFPVPKQYRGEKDVALVTEHPDYLLEKDGIKRIVRTECVDLIERFPTENGYYYVEPKHGIVTGDRVVLEEELNQRERIDIDSLNREDRFVSPIIVYGFGGDGGRYMRMSLDIGNFIYPSTYATMLLECPDYFNGAEEILELNGNSLIKNLSIPNLKGLIRDAEANLDEVSQLLKPEKLTAMKCLLQALGEKKVFGL